MSSNPTFLSTKTLQATSLRFGGLVGTPQYLVIKPLAAACSIREAVLSLHAAESGTDDKLHWYDQNLAFFHRIEA